MNPEWVLQPAWHFLLDQPASESGASVSNQLETPAEDIESNQNGSTQRKLVKYHKSS